MLCLDCIARIVMDYTDPVTKTTPCWARAVTHVPGLAEQLYSRSGAMRLVEAISEEGARWSAGTWTSAAITRHLLGAIAVAVQRGNALAMLSGYSSATRAAAAGQDETERE